MGYSITPEQMQALVNYAAGRLGMSPEQLAGTVKAQGLDGLASHLSAEDAAKIRDLPNDRAQAEQILQSPQAQALLRQLTGGDHT